jgi:hypothetical protein
MRSILLTPSLPLLAASLVFEGRRRDHAELGRVAASMEAASPVIRGA